MMTWDEKAVFLEAIALCDVERARYLDAACPDASARERIERLLQRHSELSLRLTIGEEPAGESLDRLRPGDRLDEFVIVGPIGEGGMGEVLLAEDLVLGRQVAIKVLAPEFARSERALARFRSEARAAAKLDHPGIVPIHSLGECGGRHFIVSEYVRGETLAAAIAGERRRRGEGGRDAALDAAWTSRIVLLGIAIAEALDAAHRAGIVHCDVKPENILLDPVRGPRLTDFGVARELSERAANGKELEIAGSVHYMSPEQASLDGAPVDARSDIYSLGVVLYESLALRRPIEGSSVGEVLSAVRHPRPKPLRQLAPTLSRDLETIVQTAMDASPGRRYQTAAHVAAELRSHAAGKPIIARPASRARRAIRWLGAHRAGALAGLFSLAVAAAIGLGAWVQRELEAQRLWITVTADAAADVFVQRASSPRLERFGPARREGSVPLDLRLDPGPYRITVVRADRQAWVEFDLPSGAAGPEGARELRVLDRWPTIELEDKERILLGRFVPTSSEGMIAVASLELPSADGEAIEPTERIAVAPFAIDPTECSRSDIDAFRAATGWPFGGGWSLLGGAAPDRPATILSDLDAAAFARYHGKRLPTAQEWEAAARGEAALLVPPGHDPASAPPVPVRWLQAWVSASLGGRIAAFLEGTVGVDSDDPRVLPNGLRFMDGNVREMTSSHDEIGAVVVKGRAFFDAPDGWNFRMEVEAPPAESDIHVGFRCAASVSPPAP